MRLVAAASAILLVAASLAPAQPARIALGSVKVTGWENLSSGASAVDAVPWIQRFTERWGSDYGAWAQLVEARASGTQASAQVEVNITRDGFRTRVTLTPSGGKALESRAAVTGHIGSALLAALSGDLFFLWVQAGGFALQPPLSAPPLSALLALDSLRLLPGWKPEVSEPLDCAAGPDGPMLLFSDRLLALDGSLDIAPGTARDLLLRPPFPSSFRPDRAWLDPLGEPVLFSAATGDTLCYTAGFAPERHETGFRQPVHVAALPRGGLAVLASGKVTLVTRRGGATVRQPLPLPGGFYAAVEGDAEGNVWVLDIVERRVRILDARGREFGSVKPALDPARLPFPQVFAPLPDGGLLLGGGGELWRFDARGVPVWRMNRVFTGVSEGLPAYFRVAVAPPGPQESGQAGLALYLLDPLGRKLFRFDDTTQRQEDAEPAALLGRLEAGSASPGEVVQYALDRGLVLLAQTILQAAMPESGASAGARLARLAKVRLLRALTALADREEAGLELKDAEAALGEAARLAGELRAADPVEPSYAQDLSAIAERRARLREELLPPSEPSLETDLRRGGTAETPDTQAVLTLRNPSIWPAEAVSVQARWAGFPEATTIEWMEPIRPGYEARVPLPAPKAGQLDGYSEEITLSLSVLVSWRQNGKDERCYLRAAIVRPAGADNPR